ncbi:MAG: metallopeptidase family protein [Microbacteriaceae bacterium]|nr:metallopeptidase family protein [Microbacteriaceae bacterium]
MAQGNRRGGRGSSRTVSRNRHGRGIRAAVTGPRLPLLRTRATIFEATVAATAEYLKDLWPNELSGMRVEVAALPTTHSASGRLARWSVSPAEHGIVLYRLPIERLARLHRNDDLHRRMLVESCVFRAVAELLGKEPWDLAPERFRHF